MIAETWEETKRRLKKDLGISLKQEDEIIVVPTPRYESTPEPIRPPEKLFNIHKRSLPVGIDEVVVRNLTRAEAISWVCPDLPKLPRLKTKVFYDEPNEMKTYIYYDIVPVDGTPRERSVYFNPRPFVVKDGVESLEQNRPGTPLTEIDWK